MNAEQVLRDMRVCFTEGECDNCSRIDDEDCVDGLCKDIIALIESLTAELAESRRREKAAVADLKHMDNCDICKHGQTAPDGCDCECDECTLPCVCRDCHNEDKWQWRGPSDREAHHDA